MRLSGRIKIRFLQLFSSKGMGLERKKSLPQLSRDGDISSVIQNRFMLGLSMFQNIVSLTFMFFARIETRYVVLGFRPESERESVGNIHLQKMVGL